MSKNLLNMPFRNLEKPQPRINTKKKELKPPTLPCTKPRMTSQKMRSNAGPAIRLTRIPMFARSFGAYTIHLSFGTSQKTKIPFVMNTSSSFVWLPCTTSYRCTDCSFPNVKLQSTPIFNPTRSLSECVDC